jgi:hypothetical protein
MSYRQSGEEWSSRFGALLGTMTFGEEWGFGAEESECRAIFDAFSEAGLQETSRISLGYPHSFLESRSIQKLLYGKRFQPTRS